MEPITFFCTVCGAAALSHGIVRVLDRLNR